MLIAVRLKALREQKNMFQGEIEKRIGLFRCCISGVENSHTVPASILWKSSSEPWKYQSMLFSMMERNHWQPYQN
jgi:hypothetical protein